MKKKLFILHSVLLFLSLTIMLMINISSLEKENEKNSEAKLSEVINVTRNILDEYKDTNNAISDVSKVITQTYQNVRVTFIDTTGTVLYDTNKDSIEENHLDREEIKNLGTYVIRYSTTLDASMMYYAQLYSSTDSFYIRAAILMTTVKNQIRSNIITTSILFICVLGVFIIIDFNFLESSLKPLKREINRLNFIVSGSYLTPSEIDVDNLSNEIDKTKELIENKIYNLKIEKEKLNYILNIMNQGLIIVDDSMKVLLVNDYIKHLFNYEQKENDTLLNITILPEFNNLFRDTLNNKNKEIEVKISDKAYLLVSSIFQTNSINNGKQGVCFTLIDITYEKNLKKAKRDFFANASHELKSPLTSIIGYSEMIKNGFVTSPEEINSSLDRILFEAKRMNEIVIEMLELSRLETNEVIVSKENVSLLNTTKQVINAFSKELQDKNIKLTVNDDDFNVLITNDDLYSLIKNLVENAIRYNKDNGEINITINSKENTIKIFDTGIGIDNKYKERIFERFFRIDKARSKKLGGTGLGLSIVKYICINNNIKISLDSVLNEYTEFTLKFENNN